MRRETRILFDKPGRTDRVTLAIAAVDSVTGALVRKGARARVVGLEDRPILNASGMLVFVNLPDQPNYEVEVEGGAGFPFVERLVFTPPAANDRNPAARRRDVLLVPAPDYPFPAGTTLVRGVVKRGPAHVPLAAITAAPAAGGQAFAARSVETGAFALALRLPPLGTHEQEAPVPVRITIAEGGDTRSFVRPIANGRSHSFVEPIDLAGGNDPDLFVS